MSLRATSTPPVARTREDVRIATAPDRFDADVLACADQIRGFIRARVRSAADAEDLAQDVMLKVFRSRPSLRDPSRLRAWLYRTARTAIADHFRQARETEPADERLSSPPPDFDQLGTRLQHSIRRFVAGLPETYRAAVTLADLEDLPVAVVATRLGLSLSAAKSRVARGRELLRSRLFACCRFEVDRFGAALDFAPRESACKCERDTTAEAPPPSSAAGRPPVAHPPPDYGPAEPDDGATIVRLLREAGLPTSDLGPASWAHFRIARCGGDIVGTVGIEPHDTIGLLRSFVVAPAFRGAGVGRALMREAEAHARQIGLRQLWLLTTTAADYFARHDFARMPRESAPTAIRDSAEFCALCPDSAVLMSWPVR